MAKPLPVGLPHRVGPEVLPHLPHGLMRRPVVTALTPASKPLSKAAQRDTWHAFMTGGTRHSSQGLTLWWLIEVCEMYGVPYRLTAYPGKGYHMEPVKEVTP